MRYPKIASLKTIDQFRARLDELKIQIPVDEVVQNGLSSTLNQPINVPDMSIGNRFAILPMEGWDGTLDGNPSELTLRRWRRFGGSGAKLIWGGEAVAVRSDGRANPNQLCLDNQEKIGEFSRLREALVKEHVDQAGDSEGLLVGLQLTHSGRFARPLVDRQLQPQIAYHHPYLERIFELDDRHSEIFSDDDIKRLIDDFIRTAVLAEKSGFQFVDIKHCHGYFGHELLSAFDRPGDFGGSLENRTRFLRDVVAGIRANTSQLGIGVRLSIFDFCPFLGDGDSEGKPQADGSYEFAFGGDGTGLAVDLSEPKEFISLLRKLDIRLVCTTAGSPYYNPHIQRPAQFPPSDGYLPPEDPLVGVARQINATADLKRDFPDMVVVGSGYSYLQEWLPHVAQAVIRAGWADSIGMGRMALSYPDLPLDVFQGNMLKRKQICRTFSDCTTAPRTGLVSGCYPLDDFYQSLPEREQLVQLKKKSAPKD